MGWWRTIDGTGVVGDGPSDTLGAALEQSLGTPVDVDLFGGFLAAFGSALLRNPTELVSDPPRPGTPLAAEFANHAPLVVTVEPLDEPMSLDDAVFDALESVVFEYRETGPERLPRLSELLDTLAFVARGKIVDRDGETPLELVRIRALTPELARAELTDPDWRARMAALLAIGHFRAQELARHARETEVPATTVGLRDVDRRALLALRDLAAARAEGVPLDRPTHPDPETAARRKALLDDVEAAIDGTALPGPDSAAYVLHALLDPEAVRDSGRAPPEWRSWLSD